MHAEVPVLGGSEEARSAVNALVTAGDALPVGCWRESPREFPGGDLGGDAGGGILGRAQGFVRNAEYDGAWPSASGQTPRR
jgi:hypothetical protein